MAEELLSLKWNNHQTHFVDILTLLREKDMFIDATIACGGKVYSAHKFVLSTCSDYFKQIFTRSPNSNPIVFMKDVSCRDIEALLDFMYNGEVSVPQSSLGSLIKTAEGLQIKGLAVPDDPPSSRRQQDRDKRERDPSLSFPENRSPPPKRRVREKNTPPRRLSNHQQQSRPSNSATDNNLLESSSLQTNNDPSENSSALVRNNSPGVGSESSVPSDNNSSNNKKQHNNVNANSRKHSTAEEEGDEDRGGGGEDSNHDEDSAETGSLQHPQHDDHDDGLDAAAVTHSKQEEMEIKQEDVVDLGEDDDGGEWGDGGGMGDGGADDGVGGNDSLSSADNTVNFSDVLLSHSEGGAMAGGSGAAGDAAMNACGGSASSSYRHTLVPVISLNTASLWSTSRAVGSAVTDSLSSSSSYPASSGLISSAHSSLQSAWKPEDNPLLYRDIDSTSSSSMDPLSLVLGSSYRGFAGGRAARRGTDASGSYFDVSQRSSDSISSGRSLSAIIEQSSSVAGVNAEWTPFRMNSREQSGERRHECHVCHKAFKMRHHLVEHHVVHLNEKPFKCPQCPLRFKRSKQVKYHVRLRHPEVDPSTLIVERSVPSQDESQETA